MNTTTNDIYPAFEVSPVPVPGPDAEPPELFRGIYGMPQYVTAPTADLAASTAFWVDGLGFFEIFGSPGQVTHLRRWQFQDVLLVPGDQPAEPPAVGIGISCVESQLDGIATACEELLPGSTTGPRVMPWNSVELEVITPENLRVVMTAARPFVPESLEAQNVRDLGIDVP